MIVGKVSDAAVDFDAADEVLDRKDEPLGGGGRGFGVGREDERVGIRGGGPAVTRRVGEVTRGAESISWWVYVDGACPDDRSDLGDR